LKPCLR